MSGPAALDFGVSIRPTPHGADLESMLRTNRHFLQTAAEHDLSCWIVDHLQAGSEPILECFAMLAFLAGQQPGLCWGTLVLGQAYRNPALTAKIAVTLQVLTAGRFILGLGAGDAEAEHRAYGYAFPRASTRVEQLDEAAAIIRLLWSSDVATFHGTHYSVEQAVCLPKPTPPPILMIGGAGERRTLPVVARHADWWNCDYYAPAEYARKLALLHDCCRAIGRDPATLVPTLYMGISVSYDPERLVRRRFMGHRGEVHVVSGTPDEVTRQLEAFAGMGVRHMPLNFLDYPRTESFDLFVDRVLPRFERVQSSAGAGTSAQGQDTLS